MMSAAMRAPCPPRARAPLTAAITGLLRFHDAEADLARTAQMPEVSAEISPIAWRDLDVGAGRKILPAPG